MKLNYEGGESYSSSPEMRLYKLTVNNLLENTFYREDTEALSELLTVAKQCDPDFVVKMAAYAREELYLRDVSIILFVWASRFGDISGYGDIVLQRADEPGKAIAAHELLFGPPTFQGRAKKYIESGITGRDHQLAEALENGNVQEVAKDLGVYDSIRKEGVCLSKQLKHEIERSLQQFDEYQLAKYNRGEYDLKDVLNLTHPKPHTPETDKLFNKVVNEELETPETWEVVISEKGNTKEAWESVLPRMGLFAKIRNIRNMQDAGVSPDKIVDPDDIHKARKSKIYPFRFYQAYKAAYPYEKIHNWLIDMIDATLENAVLPNSYIAVDLSGSMDYPLSPKSDMTYKEISAFFGAIMSYHNSTVLGFATNARRIKFDSDNVIDRTNRILETNVGGATNGWKAIELAPENVDRIIMLTDMQIWDTYGIGNSVKNSYENMSERPPLYMVDLSSYGDLATPQGMENVYNVSGWNEKLIDFIELSESSNPLQEVWNVLPRDA